MNALGALLRLLNDLERLVVHHAYFALRRAWIAVYYPLKGLFGYRLTRAIRHPLQRWATFRKRAPCPCGPCTLLAELQTLFPAGESGACVVCGRGYSVHLGKDAWGTENHVLCLADLDEPPPEPRRWYARQPENAGPPP